MYTVVSNLTTFLEWFSVLQLESILPSGLCHIIATSEDYVYNIHPMQQHYELPALQSPGSQWTDWKQHELDPIQNYQQNTCPQLFACSEVFA